MAIPLLFHPLPEVVLVKLRRSLKGLVPLFAVLMTPAVLGAQATSDTARVPDLVVTATRVPEPQGTVAAATTVILGEDLRARGITSVIEALREVPGVMLVQGGSYGAVTSLFLRGGESDYVKVLLDGVPLNLPGGSIDLANLSTTDLDRIEVVRGPVSVLYGADAMSGVIQLFTRAGASRPSAEASVQGGSLGTTDYAAHVSGGAAAWKGSAGGSRFASDGIYPFNSGYRNAVASGRLTWDGGARGHLAITARGGDAVAHYPTDYTGTPVDHNQFVTEKTLELGLDASHPLGTAWTASVQGYAARNHRGATNRPDSPADTLGYGYDADADATTWRRGGEVRADWRPTSATVFSLGAGAERETIDQRERTAQNYGGGAFVARDSFAEQRTTTDLYGQLLLSPWRELSLQLGTRLDHNSAFGSHVTGRVGLSWQASRSTRLWTATGTAFKAPTFFELFAASAYEVGNPALRPEQSASIELGLEQRLAGGRVILGATGFAQRFTSLIQYLNAAPGQPTYSNLGGARSRGLELTGILAVSGALSLHAHWTLLSTAVTDSGSASTVTFAQGEALLRRPGSSGGTSLTLHPGRASLTVGLNHVGRRDDVDFRDFPATRTALPSYTTVDASLDAPLLSSGGRRAGLNLTVRAENLFAAQYQQTIGFPARGRTLLAGARLRF